VSITPASIACRAYSSFRSKRYEPLTSNRTCAACGSDDGIHMRSIGSRCPTTRPVGWRLCRHADFPCFYDPFGLFILVRLNWLCTAAPYDIERIKRLVVYVSVPSLKYSFGAPSYAEFVFGRNRLFVQLVASRPSVCAASSRRRRRSWPVFWCGRYQDYFPSHCFGRLAMSSIESSAGCPVGLHLQIPRG